jgi:tetratricopeptide (TPR) repeat protein
VASDDRSAAQRRSDTEHPGEEIIAAFAERTLPPAQRPHVERHLSDCPQCRDVLADTVAFLAAEQERPEQLPDSFRSRRRLVIAAGGLATAAGLVLALRIGWERPATPSGREPVAGLVTALAGEPNRATEGRLTGGFAYAPAPAVRRGPGGAVPSADVQIAAARIQDLAQRQPAPSTRWSLGIARLAVGDDDGAIAALGDASRAEAAGADVHSDLAAAYFARWRHRGNDEDLRASLDAANRALALDGRLPEALFNRALALEAMRAPDAAAAWQAAIDADPGTPWATEASSHLHAAR